jgi:predicted Zn-dependent protease
MCDLAARTGTVATGAFIAGVYELAIANTGGTMAYHPNTISDLHTVVMADESSGYAARVAGTVGDIEPEAVAAEAIEKALRGRDGGEIEPGEYEVVLEPYAVADMLKYFAQYAFNAAAVAQGTSFLGGRLGEPVLSPAVSVWDDGLDPAGLRQPFDFEGVQKQRVTLVEDGVARGVVHDTASAARERVTSTGHALPPTFTYLRGPFPLNLFMAGGTASHEEVISSVHRGVSVTRFHYTAVVEPKRLVLTGLTRDGTFLIEGGRVTRPLRNLRFTQDCVEALTNIDLISRTTKLERTKIFRDFFNVSRVPTLKISRFVFTGMTDR